MEQGLKCDVYIEENNWVWHVETNWWLLTWCIHFLWFETKWQQLCVQGTYNWCINTTDHGQSVHIKTSLKKVCNIEKLFKKLSENSNYFELSNFKFLIHCRTVLLRRRYTVSRFRLRHLATISFNAILLHCFCNCVNACCPRVIWVFTYQENVRNYASQETIRIRHYSYERISICRR